MMDACGVPKHTHYYLKIPRGNLRFCNTETAQHQPNKQEEDNNQYVSKRHFIYTHTEM